MSSLNALNFSHFDLLNHGGILKWLRQFKKIKKSLCYHTAITHLLDFKTGIDTCFLLPTRAILSQLFVS